MDDRDFCLRFHMKLKLTHILDHIFENIGGSGPGGRQIRRLFYSVKNTPSCVNKLQNMGNTNQSKILISESEISFFAAFLIGDIRNESSLSGVPYRCTPTVYSREGPTNSHNVFYTSTPKEIFLSIFRKKNI